MKNHIERAPVAMLKGGDGTDNAAICLQILSGAIGPKTDAVLICAASAFVFVRLVKTYSEGMELARYAIGSGLALLMLQRLREASHDRRG